MKLKYKTQISKLMFITLAMIVMTGFVSASEGDINKDGRTTATDALLYLRHSVGQDISPFNIDSVLDDVTCDNKITAADALKVLRKAVGQDISLDCVIHTQTPTPTKTVIPTPTKTVIPTPTKTPVSCDSSYPDFCIAPPPPDLDCSDIQQKDFKVLQPDPHRFDRDKDGIGCES